MGPNRWPRIGKPELLYSEIGKLKVELDWLKKKVWDQPVVMRRTWIESGEAVGVAQQCILAGVWRATIYTQQKPPVIDERELLHSRLIDEEYTRHPFYGTRRMVVFLANAGHTALL